MTRETKNLAFARTAIKKLHQGADEFNVWRQSFSNRYLDIGECDLQGLDLLALPYHASQLIKEFPDNKIVLTGLDTTGEPHLVFRIEEGSNKSIIGDIEDKFQKIAQEVRIY